MSEFVFFLIFYFELGFLQFDVRVCVFYNCVLNLDSCNCKWVHFVKPKIVLVADHDTIHTTMFFFSWSNLWSIFLITWRISKFIRNQEQGFFKNKSSWWWKRGTSTNPKPQTDQLVCEFSSTRYQPNFTSTGRNWGQSTN